MTTYTWVGKSGSSWNTPTNWSPAGAPGASDNAIVPSNAGNQLVIVAARDNVDNLTIDSGATVEIDDVLTIHGAFDNGGQLFVSTNGMIIFDAPVTTSQLGAITVLANAAIDFAGALDNSGATFSPGAAFLSGTIEGGAIAGTVRIDDDILLTLSGGPSLSGVGGLGVGEVQLEAGTLGLSGTQTIANVTIDVTDAHIPGQQGVIGPTISAPAGSVDTLAATTKITLVAQAILDFVGGGSIINNGAITANTTNSIVSIGMAQDGTSAATAPTFTNSGSIVLANSGGVPDLWVGAQTQFTNTGTIDVAGTSGIEFEDALTTAEMGTIIAASGAWLAFQGTLDNTGATFDAPTGVTVSGAITGGTIVGTIDDSTFSRHIELTLEGSLNVRGASGSGTGGIDLEGSNVLTIAGAVSCAGALNQTLGSTIDIASDDALTLTGTSTIGGIVAGAGRLTLAGGGASLDSGAQLQQADWTISGAGTVVTLDEFLTYAGVFSESSGATLTLAGLNNLTLTGGADFADATVDGAHRLFTTGASTVSGLTIGGTAYWVNSGTATQSGDDVTIGDASGGVAILYNMLGGSYDIADDSGIALGASAASYVDNAGLFEKTGGAGTSAIAANVYSSGTIAATSGTLDFQAALWGPGQSEVSGGATLEVDGDVGARASLVFSGAGTISLHDLDVAGVKLFHGTISGFGVGDSLDVGTAFGAGTVPTFWENPSLAFGYLTLTNGATTETIKLFGDYATANFTPSLNASGATVLTFHA